MVAVRNRVQPDNKAEQLLLDVEGVTGSFARHGTTDAAFVQRVARPGRCFGSVATLVGAPAAVAGNQQPGQLSSAAASSRDRTGHTLADTTTCKITHWSPASALYT